MADTESSPPPSYKTDAPSDEKSSFMGNIASSVSNGIGSASSMVADSQKSVAAASKDYGMTIIVAIVVGIIFFIIAYMLYLYIVNRLTNKIVYLVPDTKTPLKGTSVNVIDGGGLPSVANGSRITFMFWIYIHDLNMFAGDDLRHILHVGDKSPTGASPEVYLDGKKNKIYIRFSKDTDMTGAPAYTSAGPTNLADQITRGTTFRNKNAAGTVLTDDKEYLKLFEDVDIKSGDTDSYITRSDAIKTDLATHGVIIEYVPLQRWVHVAVVVNETVNRGYIRSYVDGELVATSTSDDSVKLDNDVSVSVNYTGLNLAKKGDIYIGGDIYNTDTPRGFSGLVSRVTVSNYDMNGSQIRNIYVKGPVDSLTSKLGLGAYGVRNPIYKVGS